MYGLGTCRGYAEICKDIRSLGLGIQGLEFGLKAHGT